MLNYFEGYTREEKSKIENDVLEKIKKMSEEEVSDLLFEYEENMKKYDKQYNYYCKKSDENDYDKIAKDWAELMKVKEKASIEYLFIYDYYCDSF